MGLADRVRLVQSRREFIAFVNLLLKQYQEQPEEWGQNRDIQSYLTAVKASAASIDGVYLNDDEPFPEQPTWRLFAEILWMATDYE